MMCEKIGAVGEYGRQRNLNLGLVDSAGNLAYQITEHQPDHCPTQYGLQESPHSRCQTEVACDYPREENLKQDHGCPVIEKAFSFEKERQPFRNPHFLRN